jgi:uncharacterized membrane protein
MDEFNNYSVTDLPSPKRLESLADGVFAVSMTLLALGLAMPELFRPLQGTSLILFLSRMWPKFVIYGLSFLVLGMFWVLHQKLFRMILGYDGVLLWINIIFLMFVALAPFSALLLSTHYSEWLAIILYGTNQIVICQLLFLNWCYASHRHRLIKLDTSPHQCKILMIFFQFISLGFLSALVVASFNPILAVILFGLTLVITIALLASRHRILYSDQREIEE